MNSGLGWSLLSSYTFFPFLPTLTTLYLINVPGRGCCRYPVAKLPIGNTVNGRRMYGKTRYIPETGIGDPPPDLIFGRK